MNLIIRKMIAFGSLIIFIYPILLVFSNLYPWKEGVEVLNQNYPDEYFFQVGGSSKYHLNDRKVVKRKYLVLPSDKLVDLIKINDMRVEVDDITSNALIILVFGYMMPLLAFIFVGMPFFKEHVNFRLKN